MFSAASTCRTKTQPTGGIDRAISTKTEAHMMFIAPNKCIHHSITEKWHSQTVKSKFLFIYRIIIKKNLKKIYTLSFRATSTSLTKDR